MLRTPRWVQSRSLPRRSLQSLSEALLLIWSVPSSHSNSGKLFRRIKTTVHVDSPQFPSLWTPFAKLYCLVSCGPQKTPLSSLPFSLLSCPVALLSVLGGWARSHFVSGYQDFFLLAPVHLDSSFSAPCVVGITQFSTHRSHTPLARLLCFSFVKSCTAWMLITQGRKLDSGIEWQANTWDVKLINYQKGTYTIPPHIPHKE